MPPPVVVVVDPRHEAHRHPPPPLLRSVHDVAAASAEAERLLASLPAGAGEAVGALQRRLWPALLAALGAGQQQQEPQEARLLECLAGLSLHAARLLAACVQCRDAQPVVVGTVGAAALWCAGEALGAPGARCTVRLMEQPSAVQQAWLAAQLLVLQAARWAAAASGEGGGTGAGGEEAGDGDGESSARAPLTVGLLPLWSCLKANAGLRSAAPGVRLAAMQLLGEALAPAAPTSGAGASPLPTQLLPRATGVSLWAFCQALLPIASGSDAGGGVAAGMGGAPGHGEVQAAAVSHVGRMLEGCHSSCDSRAWRQVAQAVLQAGTSPSPEVRQAAEDVARRQRGRPGWYAAVHHLQDQLLEAAAGEEGPLKEFGVEAVCQAAAGAAVLGKLTLGPPCGGAEGERPAAGSSGGGTSGSRALKLALAAAVCISDAQRQAYAPSDPQAEAVGDGGPGAGGDGAEVASREEGEAAAGDGEGPGEHGGDGSVASALAALQLDASRMSTVGVASCQGGAATRQPCSGDGDGATGLSGDASPPAAAAAGVLQHAEALCFGIGEHLGPQGALELLESLCTGACTAPAVWSPGGSAPDAAGGGTQPAAAGMAGMLTAAAGVAAGAAAAASMAGGVATGSQVECCVVGPGSAAARSRQAQSQAEAAQPAAPQPQPQPQPAAAAISLAVRTARLMLQVSERLLDPGQASHSDMGGAPALPSARQAAAARQHLLAACGAAALLQSLLAMLPQPLLYRTLPTDALEAPEPEQHEEPTGSGRASDGRQGGSAGRSSGRRRKPIVLIEEVDSDDAAEGEAAAAAASSSPGQRAARQLLLEWQELVQQLVPQLLLLCATYCVASARVPMGAVAARAVAFRLGPGQGQEVASAEPDLSPEPLFAPWSSPAASAAFRALLRQLAAGTSPTPRPSRALLHAAGASAGGSLSLMAGDELALQDLLASGQKALLACIRPVVVQRHVQDLEDGPLQPYAGPGTFPRALAARRLAWLVGSTRHPFAGRAFAEALPAVLACCNDPAPAVAIYGVQCLHHAALECLAADLQWQRELLLDVARRLLLGCPAELWPHACPMAVLLATRLEGRDPRAAPYHQLAAALLTEVERTAHQPERRLPFMHAFRGLCRQLGLTLLRHTARLMPLLLEWLHAHDAATRVAALTLLADVVRATWPRVPAHAPALWRQLLLVLLRAGSGERERGGREVELARGCCMVLLQCARPQVAGMRVGDGEGGTPGAQAVQCVVPPEAAVMHGQLLAQVA